MSIKKAIFSLFCSAASVFASAQQVTYVADEFYMKVAVQAQDMSAYVPNPYIIPKSYKSILEKYQIDTIYSPFDKLFPALSNLKRVKLKNPEQLENAVAELKGNADIEYVEKIPMMQIYQVPSELNKDNNQWYFSTINMNTSWNIGTGKEVYIAVIDNAVYYGHEDLYQNIMRNNAEADFGFDGIDNDANGIIDDIYGADIANGDGNPSPPTQRQDGTPNDFFSHGTHVAGIVGAICDNGKGVASLGRYNRILPIKITPDGKYDNIVPASNCVEAIAYAINRGVDVINCSWGVGDVPEKEALHDVIRHATENDIIVVAAAGNIVNGQSIVCYPAAFDEVIAVGSTDNSDRRANTSNYGNFVDVMAPGEHIFSTFAFDNGGLSDHSYGFLSGTSMAAPMVSSFVGLLLSQEIPKKDILELIKRGCDNIDDKNPDQRGKLGAGRINIDKTFNVVLPTGIAGISSKNALYIYPNPATSTLQIVIPDGLRGTENAIISIFDSKGSTVFSNAVDLSKPFDISTLGNGIYFIQLNSTSADFFQTRLVVQR